MRLIDTRLENWYKKRFEQGIFQRIQFFFEQSEEQHDDSWQPQEGLCHRWHRNIDKYNEIETLQVCTVCLCRQTISSSEEPLTFKVEILSWFNPSIPRYRWHLTSDTPIIMTQSSSVWHQYAKNNTQYPNMLCLFPHHWSLIIFLSENTILSQNVDLIFC